MLTALAIVGIVGTLTTTPNNVMTERDVTDGTDVATVELIGWRSGFAKAQVCLELGAEVQPTGPRGCSSITVGALPDSWGVDSAEWLRPVLDHWNMAAGWELFQISELETADVSFHDDAGTVCPDAGGCTNWDTFPTGTYKHCRVSFWPWQTTRFTAMHELGHCLGFVDVDDEAGEPYVGIMRYGREPHTTPVNAQDIASLEAAGYRP